MKKIKIFLASSIEDLREDRLQIGDFFRQLNELYLDHGIHFSLIKCEDYDNSIVSGGKQQEYDREIRDSELVFFLFFRKVGQYTKHEFEVALESFRNTKKPRIITYFKYIQSIDEAVQEVKDFMNLLDREMKHYYNIYGHIDTLKLGMLMQIKLLQLDTVPIKLENGAVLLDGQTVAKAENVPLLRGNQTLRDLTKKRQQLQAELSLRRSAYLTDPSEENETAFFNTSAELNRVSKQLTAVEQETLALLTTVAEMTADGRVLTHRQKEALKYFNAGNYNAVHSILEDEAREDELRRAELRAESAKTEIRGYVEEELLLIRTEKAQGLTEARVQRILSGYEKIMELTQKHDLDKKILYDYAEFLYAQNRHNQAIAVAEKLRWYYDAPNATIVCDEQLALSNLLGNLYRDTHCYEPAEINYTKALEFCQQLRFHDPNNYETALALIYNNMGVLYSYSCNFTKAEEIYQKALQLYLSWSAQSPEHKANADIAGCYNNLGKIFHETGRFQESEESHQKALEIRLYLAAKNPDAFESDLVVSYNNLGDLYTDIQRYHDAEEAYRKALEINIRLATNDPWLYENDLAHSYNNLGLIYHYTQHYNDAEDAFRKAIEISLRLNSRDPDRFGEVLAGIYDNLGNLYSEIARFDDAEKSLKQALEVRKQPVTHNSESNQAGLAATYNNLGVLYWRAKQYDEAEEAYRNALEIRLQLAQQHPQEYEKYLAKTFYNMGMLYQAIQRLPESQNAYEKALEIYIRLTEQAPDLYELRLATLLWKLASVYEEQQLETELRAHLRIAQPIFERLAQKSPDHYSKKLAIIRQALDTEQ